MVGVNSEPIHDEQYQSCEQEKCAEEHKHLVSPKLGLNTHAWSNVLNRNVDKATNHEDQNCHF